MGRSMTASSRSENEGRELIPPGTYRAVVLGFAEIGSHDGPYGLKSQAVMTFELWKKGQVVGQISQFYNRSFDVAATLRKHVQAMLGRTFQDGDDFDPEDLLQQTCRIQVGEKKKKDGTLRDFIEAVMAADEEDAEITPRGAVFFFQLPDEPEKCPIPDEVPEWIGKKIQESQEWLGHRVKTPEPAPPTTPQAPPAPPKGPPPAAPQPAPRKPATQHTSARVGPNNKPPPAPSPMEQAQAEVDDQYGDTVPY